MVLFDKVGEELRDYRRELIPVPVLQAIYRAGRINSCGEQDFSGVDISDSRDNSLIQQALFYRFFARSQTADQIFGGKGSITLLTASTSGSSGISITSKLRFRLRGLLFCVLFNLLMIKIIDNNGGA